MVKIHISANWFRFYFILIFLKAGCHSAVHAIFFEIILFFIVREGKGFQWLRPNIFFIRFFVRKIYSSIKCTNMHTLKTLF